MAATSGESDPDDLHSVVNLQTHELMAALSLESDLDLAFHLQIQEALAASLSPRPSSPPPPPVLPDHPPPQKDSIFALTAQELSKFHQETLDHKRFLLETQILKEDLQRRAHDHKFARQIVGIPDDQWQEWGDNFERPFGEGSSKGVETEDDDNDCDSDFRLYFKGLVSEETTKNERVVLAGVGVAICDRMDNLILEIKKPLAGVGLSKQAAEIKALIEGLHAALSLELKRIQFFCDYFPIFQFVTGRWQPRQRKIVMLLNQVFSLQRKFTYCKPTLVARNDVKYAFKFAREAIVSQVYGPVESNCDKTMKEACVICLEDTDEKQMFSVDECLHRYCFSCMKQHVEVKLLYGTLPKCPHEVCKSELSVDSCQKFLTPKTIETWKQRIKEASIPVTEKVYCPYPRCSALMSRDEISEYSRDIFVGAERSSARKCLKCHGLFCINCKVPWHRNMTCHDYRRLNPYPLAEDVKLKSLATRNLWRQCVKCNHMIELSVGCYHITCRCGHEFCYICGAEYRNKRATCSCPLWDEDNILHEDEEEDLSDEEDLNDEVFTDSDDDDYWVRR